MVHADPARATITNSKSTPKPVAFSASRLDRPATCRSPLRTYSLKNRPAAVHEAAEPKQPTPGNNDLSH